MLRSSIDAHRYGKSTSATAFLNTYTNKIKISTTTVDTTRSIQKPLLAHHVVPVLSNKNTALKSIPSQTKMMTSSTTTSTSTEALDQTPLGSKDVSHLLAGLDIYTIKGDDGHPLSVYGIHSTSENNSNDDNEEVGKRIPILLLHGRTWSSVPVFHLLGGTGTNNDNQNSNHSRSLIEYLYDEGLQPYAMDFRGFGGTPSDSSGVVVPNTCVKDVECALKFIIQKHCHTSSGHNHQLPALLGWSQGALVAQLFAQKHPQDISKLVLYGSIYDPLVSYPPIPLYANTNQTVHDDQQQQQQQIKNTYNSAIEDFTIEGSIPPEPAALFAHSALISDPYKAQWHYLSQFNNLDPARVSVPTLVVAGDQDPYAPIRVQSALFSNLGRGADRTWSIIADADHAVHLLDSGRDRLVNIVKSFVENSKKSDLSN